MLVTNQQDQDDIAGLPPGVDQRQGNDHEMGIADPRAAASQLAEEIVHGPQGRIEQSREDHRRDDIRDHEGEDHRRAEEPGAPYVAREQQGDGEADDELEDHGHDGEIERHPDRIAEGCVLEQAR
jgi:hypothetical protein